MHGRRHRRRPRRRTSGHRAVRAARGLPRRASSSSHGGAPTPSRGWWRSTAPPTRCAWVPLADIESGATPVDVAPCVARRSRMRLGAMTETVFTYGAPALKFGAGAAAEIGHDLAAFGARRVLLVTDPGVAATGHPARIAEQIAGARHRGDDVRRRPRRADRRVAGRGGRVRAATRGRWTRSSRSAAAPPSTPPRRSTCSSPTRAS